jgi:hypothetical protein
MGQDDLLYCCFYLAVKLISEIQKLDGVAALARMSAAICGIEGSMRIPNIGASGLRLLRRDSA